MENRFMKKLLEIEGNQMALDSDHGSIDIEALNLHLDQVTLLRREVLRDVTAHEVAEDSSMECFINMCHALSNKINAKITRQRFDRYLAVSAEEDGSTGLKKKKARKRKRAKKGKKRTLKG